MKKQLIKAIGTIPCEGPEEGCPIRKNGNCSQIDRLDYCAVAAMADHLIAEGVVIPVRCGKCQHWIRNIENRKDYGTCFVAGFTHGVEKHENGFCERGERA